MPRALTTQECDELVKKFIVGANIAKAAGVDGVELHAAHGYLINQFLSPYTNKRDDAYGGTFEKRMKFIHDIILGVRATCGPDFIISVRISADEFVEGGLKIEDSVKISKLLESYGINVINVSAGIYESSSTIVEDYVYKQAWKKHLAAQIKKNVSIPVIAVNNIKRPEVAEELLQEGVCDYVALGRQQLADPQWGNKSKAGIEDEIRPCIACLYCFKEIGQVRNIKCTVNARAGRELEFEKFKNDGNNRLVAVIGGGPAGMEAARVLALRGFKVTLFEKTAKLGGTLNVADKPPHKEYLTWLSNNLEAQIKKLGVEIKLNTEATIESIKTLNPYAVFVALGGNAVKPKLEGIDNKNVYMAEDVILGKVKFKDKNLLVIGGGVTGLETAEVTGVDNKVTVVEMQNKVGTALYHVILIRLMARLKGLGDEVKGKHKLESIQDKSVTLKNLDNSEVLNKEADPVILALGVCPDKSLVEKIKDSFSVVKVVGDAQDAGLISDAIREGFEKAFVLE
jgi:NADPH-dependent 2,4-dienoyl-CoA reductase/sulfur reductase-like enzyme